MTTLTDLRITSSALTKFLDKAIRAGLPEIASIALGTSAKTGTLSIHLQLHTAPDAQAWERVCEWGRFLDAPVLLTDSKRGYDRDYREASVVAVFQEVEVKIWDHLDGMFTRPDREIAQVSR